MPGKRGVVEFRNGFEREKCRADLIEKYQSAKDESAAVVPGRFSGKGTALTHLQ